MNSYITYEYYTQTFGGTLVPQSEFNKYSIQASNEVRIRIMGVDITTLSDSVKSIIKTLTCSVMELVYNQEQLNKRYMEVAKGNEAIVTSEKVGDYSRNIATLNASELKEESSNETTNVLISEMVEKALLFTGLLNRGMNVQ